MTSVFVHASGVYGAFGGVLFLSLVCFASASLRSIDMTTAQYLLRYCFWPMTALVVLGLFVYGVVVTIRVMWDPVYCSMIATSSDIHIAFSHPIRQIGPSVHVSEHNIDSGDGHCGCFHGREITKLSRMVAESGRPGRAELLAKKGRIVGGVGCSPNCRTSGKRRGSSGKLRPFRTF